MKSQAQLVFLYTNNVIICQYVLINMGIVNKGLLYFKKQTKT